MVEYIESSQNNAWHFASKREIEKCRAYANYRARQFLYQREKSGSAEPVVNGSEAVPDTSSMEIVLPESTASSSTTEWSPSSTSVINSLPVSWFACCVEERRKIVNEAEINDYLELEPWSSPTSGHAYLTPNQELTLIHFYGSKISALIGRNAEIDRLRRDNKVVATAAVLYRRFFLSNSVLLHDPKVIMVAAAFLACKVEDVTVDIRYLEQATALMNVTVTIPEIVTAEVMLLSGVHFDLLCFHPYKAVLALTEDLRTFLKTQVGRAAFSAPGTSVPLLQGADLKSLFDISRTLLDSIIVSDLPLLYSPGQIGLAALTVAHNRLLEQQPPNASMPPEDLRDVLCRAYLPSRFPNEMAGTDMVPKLVQEVAEEIRGLQQQTEQQEQAQNDTMLELKAIHKQLKKVRIWGKEEKKKSKKRKGEATEDPATEEESTAKRARTE
jgi:cyclin H